MIIVLSLIYATVIYVLLESILETEMFGRKFCNYTYQSQIQYFNKLEISGKRRFFPLIWSLLYCMITVLFGSIVLFIFFRFTFLFILKLCVDNPYLPLRYFITLAL